MTFKRLDPFSTAYIVIVAIFAVICLVEREPRVTTDTTVDSSITGHFGMDHLHLSGT
jgi:hypothetical protein